MIWEEGNKVFIKVKILNMNVVFLGWKGYLNFFLGWGWWENFFKEVGVNKLDRENFLKMSFF